MFEDKNINEFDQMMKSILDEGREEVPASVWEGVSAGLDKAEKHKTVVLWWRRAAAGAAVAAAVAVGVIFNHTPQQELVPQAGDSGMIAVAEPAEEIVAEETEIVIPDMIAEAEPVVKPVRNAVIKTADEAIEVVTDVAPADEIPVDIVPADKVPADKAPADEKEDCRASGKSPCRGRKRAPPAGQDSFAGRNSAVCPGPGENPARAAPPRALLCRLPQRIRGRSPVG